MNQPNVVLAGATGDQGLRTAIALSRAGAHVRALVRTDSGAAQDALRTSGATLIRTDLSDVGAVADALAGASCVVSTLGGLRDVIVDRQSILLDAAVQADVPRFIPSDYSADYTRTAPGGNRNFDLRREFTARADRAPLQVTSILNGAFLDMLGAEMPLIQPRLGASCTGDGETNRWTSPHEMTSRPTQRQPPWTPARPGSCALPAPW